MTSVCVIGAGPSGITAAKHLLQAGLTDVTVYEKNNQVGGNWVYSPAPGHSSVYETAHIISSKTLSAYHDFPMPDHYPDYPNHELLKAYFQSYAEHFGVNDVIRFNTAVTQAVKLKDHRWRLTLDDGQQATFDYLLVANGHHWDPRWPDYPGDYTGDLLHTHHYRTHLPFRGKRVLIIGGGNSACDIAVDVSRHAAVTRLSWRRGYYVSPKFLFGQPADVVNARIRWMPRWLRARFLHLAWRIIVGGNDKYGLPKPDHNILDSHPVLNSKLLYHIRHGDIDPRGDIRCWDGKRVEFLDGTVEEYDTIICGTGYKISFPFFADDLLNFTDEQIPLYLRVFPAEHPTLAFIGLVQPQGCIWPLADTQSELVAAYITGRYHLPADLEQRITEEVTHIRERYNESPRHTIEVDYHSYLQRLRQALPKGQRA